jgi:hypothetical protein
MPLANLHATSADSALFRSGEVGVGVGCVPTYARMRTRAHTASLYSREEEEEQRRELVRCIPDSATRPTESPVKKGK